jgi:hypothetical protein
MTGEERLVSLRLLVFREIHPEVEALLLDLNCFDPCLVRPDQCLSSPCRPLLDLFDR